jgi:site-specific recombinase XerD
MYFQVKHIKQEVCTMTDYEDDINLYFELRGTPESSRESYFRRMNAFLEFIKEQQKDIKEINHSDIQQYILYLKKEKCLAPGTINNYISGIKFFYTHVLDKEWDSKKIPYMKLIHKMPVIPSADEIIRMLNAEKNLKHKAILYLIYGSGLRVSEVAKLKISDICSKNMRVRVDGAKHNTNRYTILSQTALLVLRQYFRENFKDQDYKPDSWLFPGCRKDTNINVKSVKNMILHLRDRQAMDKNVSAHVLRHCFATHSLENGVDPVLIQQMLGHKSLKTTLVYLHMTSKSLMGVKSPLDIQSGETK